MNQTDLLQKRLNREKDARKQAEALLEKKSLQLQSAALEAAADAIAITDRAGQIIWVNPAFCAMTGYSAEEAVEQNPRVLKSGKHKDSFYTDLWQTIISGSE